MWCYFMEEKSSLSTLALNSWRWTKKETCLEMHKEAGLIKRAPTAPLHESCYAFETLEMVSLWICEVRNTAGMLRLWAGWYV